MMTQKRTILLLFAMCMSFTGMAWGSLVMHLPFESDVNDATGNFTVALGGIPEETVYPDPAVGTGSLALDGTSGYLTLGTSFPLGTDSFTWSMWVNLEEKRGDTSAFRHQLVQNGNGKASTQLFVNREGKLGFYASPDGIDFSGIPDVLTTSTVDDSQWHHVAAVLDRPNGYLNLYIDGVLDASQQVMIYDYTNLTVTTNSDNTLYLGRCSYNSARYMNGLLDEVRFYGEALDATQIGELANAQLPTGAANDLMVHLPLDTDVNDATGVFTSTVFGGAVLTAVPPTNVPIALTTADAAVGSGAIELDGTTGYLNLGPSVVPGTSDFSVAMWVKLDEKRGDTSAFRHQLLQNGTNGSTQLFVSRYGTLGFYSSYGITDTFSTATVDDGQWHHIAVAIDRANGQLTYYIDGEVDSTASLAIAPSVDMTPVGGDPNLYFGFCSYNPARGTDGLLDDIRFYDEALTQSQIYALLGVTPDLPGDANRDGKVDGSDVTILAGNWQTLTGANWGMGDFNGDGKVDGSDVTILAGNWQAGVDSTAASVPEPSVFLMLLGMGFVGWMLRKK